MIKNDFYIPCGKEKLHCIEWRPETRTLAVLQIVHGMVEYVDRYDGFARFLCGNGIAVVGHDHPGHGKTAANENELGYIDTDGGSALLCFCADAVTNYIGNTYPGVKNFILGHSMGSFVVRRYITKHSDKVSGAIIVGTGTPPLAVLNMGKLLAKAVIRFKGDHHPSELLTKISFAGYNSRFSKEEDEHAWISSDRALVEKYDKDPFCSYTFRVGGFLALYETLIYLAKKENIDKIDKDLPVLITAGKDDPVGSYGKGPSQLRDVYCGAGLSDVTLKLFEGRHEIINEVNKEKVYESILEWICAYI